METDTLFDGRLEDTTDDLPSQEAPPEPPATPDATETALPTTTEPAAEESFFDPKTIPDELLPAYKQMQTAFTKRQQESAEAKRKLESIEKELPQYKQAHDALTRLVTDPVYRAQVFGAADARNPQIQGPAAETPQSFYGVDVSKLETESQLQVKELAAQAVMEKFAPPIRELWNEVQSLKQQLALNDWNQVLTENPKGQEKLNEVSGFLAQNPNFFKDQPQKVRFQKALKLFLDDAPVAQESTATANKPANGTRNNADLRAAQVARPGLPARNAKPSTGNQSLADLLRTRSRELGISWPDG